MRRFLLVLVGLVALPALGSAPTEPPAPSRDVALLRALLAAFEPSPLEIRVIAVEDLALLGDARALNALAQLALDPNPAVQAAALRAVSRFRTARAEEILCNAVRYRGLHESLRIQALEVLPLQGTLTAWEFVQRIGNNNAYGLKIQDAARKTLTRWGPAPRQ